MPGREGEGRGSWPPHSSHSSGDTIPNSEIAIRSIFSTCNALCQGGLLTLLDVPPSVCYPNGRRWQRRGPKPGEQRNLDLRIGRESASRHDDCQHQGGRGPAVQGKVNPGEVLIKVVIGNKPKMLSGLNQKYVVRHRGFLVPRRGLAPPADRHDLLPRQESFASLHILTRRASEGSEALPSLARRVRMSFFGARVITPGSIEKVNEVTPLSPREGRLPARKPMGQRGRDEGGSERRSVVDRIEGESSHGQHSLTAKAS